MNERSQWSCKKRILDALKEMPRATSRELSTMTEISTSNLCKRLNDLEAQGVISHELHTTDDRRKIKHYSLTFEVLKE